MTEHSLESHTENEGIRRLLRAMHLQAERERRSAEIVRLVGARTAARIDPWLYVQQVEQGLDPFGGRAEPIEEAAA
jgi:hypothetical protein